MGGGQGYGPLRVLSWNLFHGRANPDRRGGLVGQFAPAIAALEWDLALLQEVPPWWPPVLAAVSGADWRAVATSRNQLLAVRRAIAVRRPELIRSNGGGANAILVRPRAGAIAAHAQRRLRVLPERRFMHAVLLDGGAGDGCWVANIHAAAGPRARARADLDLAAATLRRWSGGAPALLGGDCNVPDPAVAGFSDLGGRYIDRFLAGPGLTAAGAPVVLERPGGLSDHPPVLISLSVARADRSRAAP